MDKLTCAICKNPLSHFPIIICSETFQNVCGRCPPPEKPIRNEIYEISAEFLKFPCRYKGCLDELSPQEVPLHEKKCLYKTVKCPTRPFSGCEWEGSKQDLLYHCRDKHSDIIFKSLKIDLTESKQCENISIYKDLVFIISWKFQFYNNTLELSVYHTEESRSISFGKYFYKVSFQNGNRTLLIDGIVNDFEDKEIKEIVSLDSLKVPSENVIGQITISESCLNDTNESILHNFKCSSCPLYVLPPIYQEEHKNTIKCEFCLNVKQKSKKIRNINLENIANMLTFPCIFQQVGCNFVSKPKEMKIHQQRCFYRTHSCPLGRYKKCDWKGPAQDMFLHIQSYHPENIKENSEEIEIGLVNEFTRKMNECYSCIIQVSKCLFRLSFSIDDGWFDCHVEKILNTFEDFRYELMIIDQSSRGDKKFSVTDKCTELTDFDKTYKFGDGNVYLNPDFIKNLFSGILTLKVHISKINQD